MAYQTQHTHVQVKLQLGTMVNDVFTPVSNEKTKVVIALDLDGSLSEHESREIMFTLSRAYAEADADAL